MSSHYICICNDHIEHISNKKPYLSVVVHFIEHKESNLFVVVVVVVLLFYVHGKHLRSCRDGQLT